MGDVDQVEPQKLLARAADDLAEAVVDRSEDAIQIDLAETGHGLRDERRKLLLVLPHGKFAIAHLPSDPHRDPDKRERRHRREQRKAELHIISADAKDRKSTRLKLQSLMRISYAVFCLKNKKKHKKTNNTNQQKNRRTT